jgi:hypothetical protein
MSPRTCGSNLLVIGNFWCLTTLHLLPQNSLPFRTCPQNPYTIYAPFQNWPWPSPTSTTSLHQVVWPLALPPLHHLGVAHVLPKLWAQLVTFCHHLKWGGFCCQMLQIVVAKLNQLQMVHPILLVHCHIIL